MLIVEIRNMGTHPQRPEFGHYEYTVKVNDKVIARGGVRDHNRRDGWAGLVATLAFEACLGRVSAQSEALREALDPDATAPPQPHRRRRPGLRAR